MIEELDLFSFSTPKFKIDKPIRLIEMFAGIGSQAKALKNLGVNFEHWKVIEWDKYAMASYNAVHGTNFETSDIKDIHAKDLDIRERERYCYILTYSFPCQDLSLAGKGKGMAKGSGTRSGLLWEVERILDECEELPQVLLMENVPQVIGKNNIKDFQLWRSKLESLGYSNYVQLLNAKDYEIPQNRNRCFMVSILGKSNFVFPNKIVSQPLIHFIETNVSQDYSLTESFLEQIKHTKYKITDYKENTEKLLKGEFDDFKIMDYRYDEGLRIRKNGLCSTLTTRGKQALSNVPIFYINKKLRFITPKECWRLMGFSDEDYDKARKVNSESQLYKQAGNSIVVNVLMAIFKEMI